jgi:hypothetical protein
MMQCRFFGGEVRPDLNAYCQRPAQICEYGLVLCEHHYEAAHMDPEDWDAEDREIIALEYA